MSSCAPVCSQGTSIPLGRKIYPISAELRRRSLWWTKFDDFHTWFWALNSTQEEGFTTAMVLFKKKKKVRSYVTKRWSCQKKLQIFTMWNLYECDKSSEGISICICRFWPLTFSGETTNNREFGFFTLWAVCHSPQSLILYSKIK